MRMRLHLQNSTTYSYESILTLDTDTQTYLSTLSAVTQANDYVTDEASLNLPFDDVMIESVINLAEEKVSPELQYVFVVGIGGSNLGTKAIYDALYGYRDLVASYRAKLVFVDTINDAQLHFYTEQLIPSLQSAEQYLLVTISKSGGTTETVANTEILLASLKEKLGDFKDRTVVITDEDSAFWRSAESAGLAKLAIPSKVGGRYSVFSAVGLFPLAAIGVDIKSLIQGAKDIRPDCLNTQMDNNPALQSAALMAYAVADGKIINDTFLFNSELESLGKWYRQLLGESIGKEYNRAGEQVHVGITPTVSIGSTDLHSVGQLYLAGPKDKLTTFVYSNQLKQALTVPVDRVFPNTVSMIDGKTSADIMAAIFGGVKIAYNKNQLPFMEVELAGITAYELGAFMQFKMIEMMLLGHLLNVNPFDQPNVELYKIGTKQLLEI
jgi:glucose-6-phosphate isomerase